MTEYVGNIKEIEAREKAATAVRNTASYWAEPWRMRDTVEIRASWFQPLVSDLGKASELVDGLLVQLKDREEKLAAEKERLAEEIKVVIAADSGDAYFKGRLSGLLYVQDRILQGGE